jgi:hypothetical protein
METHMTDKTEAMGQLIAQDADLIDAVSKVEKADREVLIRISNSDDETAQRIRRGLIYTWEVGEISRHRLEERAKIVAWLRGMGLRNINYIADAIEVGEHLK